MARFTITMPDDLKEIVKKSGERDTRNMSAQVVALVREALIKRGELKK